MRWAGVLGTQAALLRTQWWTSGRGGFRLRGGAGATVLGLMLVGFLLWTFVQTFGAFANAGVPQPTAERVFAWILQVAIVGMLVLDLQLAVTQLVAARDLELLRRAPLAPQQVLAISLLRSLPQSTGMLLAFSLPAWFGLVSAYPSLATQSFLLAPVLVLLWAVALGTGLALALALLRITPAARLREALGLLATLIVTATWLASSFLLPRVDREHGLDVVLSEMLHTLPHPPAWSPAAWAMNAMRGDGVAWAALALAALAAAALAGGASHLWLDDVQSRAASGERRAARSRPLSRARSLTAAFLRRDSALLMRDWTMVADIVTAAVLWLLLPLILAPALELTPAALLRSMLVLLATGLGYEVAARALPLERHLLVWSRLSPVGVSGWVVRRMAGVAMFSLPIMLLSFLILALMLRPSGEALAHAALLGAGAWATAIGVGFATGAMAGDPDWVHPRAMLGLGGRLIASLAAILQAGAWSVLGWGIEGAGLGPELLSALLGIGIGVASIGVAIRSVEQHIDASR